MDKIEINVNEEIDINYTSIKDVISILEKYKDFKNATLEIDVSYWECVDVLISYDRIETDNEYEKRMKEIQRKQELELEQYKYLKDKFG